MKSTIINNLKENWIRTAYTKSYAHCTLTTNDGMSNFNKTPIMRSIKNDWINYSSRNDYLDNLLEEFVMRNVLRMLILLEIEQLLTRWDLLMNSDWMNDRIDDIHGFNQNYMNYLPSNIFKSFTYGRSFIKIKVHVNKIFLQSL